MDETTSTAQFATFFAALALDDVPLDIRNAAKSLLIDTLACLRAGASAVPSGPILASSALFGGPGTASLAGSLTPVGAAQALYANARLRNLFDWDETYPVGVHFGVGAVCAAIAAAEAEGANGADLLAGIVAGYEAGGRMASAVGPMMSIRDGEVQGFSRIWGVAAPVVVAACVAYGRVVGVDSSKLRQALGIACSNIPLPIGNRWSEAMRLPDVKYCDAGWCSVTGMHGVVSALAGLTGFEDVFDGPVGLTEVYAAAVPRPQSITEGLGSRWHLEDITWTCRFIHAPMTALSHLLEKHRPTPEDLDEVVIFTGPLANSERFRNPRPSTFCGYSFSYQHAVAMMVLGIPPGAQWFEPKVADSEKALKIRAKVRIELFDRAHSFAADMVQGQIRKMPGAASLTVKGQSWTHETDYADGDPWRLETAYSGKKVEDKLRAVIGHDSAQRLLEWMKILESTASLEPLSSFIRECEAAA